MAPRRAVSRTRTTRRSRSKLVSRFVSMRSASAVRIRASSTGAAAVIRAFCALLIHAWPDRVARARGERGRFVLANGSGAMVDAADPLAGESWL
ncbi:MAG: ATP-dependent helicase HrpB, partial [Mesorhizobium sp.]